MHNVINGIWKGALAIILLVVVWFGIGSWMRSQPSTLLYWGGTVLNLFIIAPVAFIGRAAVNDFKKAIGG